MSWGRRAGAFGLAALIVVLDRATKLWIVHSVGLWETIPVIPGFFSIVHTQNRGAAFGIFADAETEWRAFLLIGLASAVIITLTVMLWQSGGRSALGDNPLLRTALSFILGGAAGNLYDRIRLGAVTDFLEFNLGFTVFPAFNVADSAITVGAALLLIDIWRTRGQQVGHPSSRSV
ncbi:MAG: signal peptidase II [Bryobacteraceae bacterium]|nr:signal peptidase II [Bryobacteraceae bacterium]